MANNQSVDSLLKRILLVNLKLCCQCLTSAYNGCEAPFIMHSNHIIQVMLGACSVTVHDIYFDDLATPVS